MILGFELRGRALVVVVEGEGRAVDILAAEGAVDALFVAEGFAEGGPGDGEAGCGCSGAEKIAAIEHGGLL
jgi:hypothetical protein